MSIAAWWFAGSVILFLLGIVISMTDPFFCDPKKANVVTVSWVLSALCFGAFVGTALQ